MARQVDPRVAPGHRDRVRDENYDQVIPTAPDSDRHPEVPAPLRGPRRMVTSSCMLASFEARFARTSSDERSCAHAGMTQGVNGGGRWYYSLRPGIPETHCCRC